MGDLLALAIVAHGECSVGTNSRPPDRAFRRPLHLERRAVVALLTGKIFEIELR